MRYKPDFFRRVLFAAAGAAAAAIVAAVFSLLSYSRSDDTFFWVGCAIAGGIGFVAAAALWPISTSAQRLTVFCLMTLLGLGLLSRFTSIGLSDLFQGVLAAVFLFSVTLVAISASRLAFQGFGEES